MSYGRVLVLLLLALLLISRPARADGGTLLTRQAAGPWIVSLFVTPAQPGRGPVDFSTMVEDRGSDQLVLDTNLQLTLTPLDAHHQAIVVPLTRAAASNKLMQAASVSLPSAGRWRAEVEVRNGEQEASVATVFSVASHSSRRALVWALAVFPFVVLALLAVADASRRRVARVQRSAAAR